MRHRSTLLRGKGKRREQATQARPRRIAQRLAVGLAAGLVLSVSTPARAAPVKHENPPHGQLNHFHWGRWANAWNWDVVLDITLSAASQPQNTGTPLCSPYGSPLPCSHHLALRPEGQDGGAGSWNDAWMVNMGIPPEVDVQADVPCGFAIGLDLGAEIPDADAFWCDGAGGESGGENWVTASRHSDGHSEIPEGVPAYLGVRIAALVSGGTWNYGWIGVVRNGGNLEAFEWGYQSDVDTPVYAGGESGPGGEGWPSIPTASEWGLMALGILVLGCGMAMFRRAHQEAA